MNLAQIFASQVERRADEPALILFDKKIDYWTLNKKVQGFAAHLKDVGAVPGTKVALCLPNVPEFVAVLLGAWTAGCVVVPINPYYKEPEVLTILEKGDVDIVVSKRGNDEVKRAVGHRHHIEVRAEGATLADLPVASGEHWADCEEALIIFTNAQDGTPKGAVLTHDNLFSDIRAGIEVTEGLGSDEVVMGALPFYHAFGLTTALLHALVQGGRSVLVPRFSPEAILKIQEETPATFFTGVPTMFASLVMGKGARHPAFAQSRLLISGGAPLTQEIYDRFLEVYGKPILQGYGLTEASPVVSLNPHAKPHKPLSVGLPYPCVQVSIDRGEVVLRGRSIMKEYYRDPEATKAVLREGTLYTGDLGYIDDDGFLFLTGHKKKMLIMGGFNVYLKEVEEVLLNHPQIQEAEVYPEPDFLFTQIPAARLKIEGALSEREVIQFCKKRLANYKVPRKITFHK